MARKEQIIKKASRYASESSPANHIQRAIIGMAFQFGAEWADKSMIEKAYRWLEENMNTPYFMYSEKYVILDDFKKAMEE